MIKTTFPTPMLQWTAIATGVIGISTLMFGLLFTFAGNLVPVFYGLNDLFNLILAILSSILAWMLYSHFRERLTFLHTILLLLVLIGVVFAVIGYRLIAFGHSGWVLSGWYTDTGFALIGLWVVGLNYTIWQKKLLPKGLSIYGVIVGAMMALGFSALPGLIANIDSTNFMSSPHYILWMTSIMSWTVLYPIWCIGIGRVLQQK